MKSIQQERNGNQQHKNSIADILAGFSGWLRIFTVPLFVGVIAGICIYQFYPRKATLVIGILTASIGLLTGIILATREWRKTHKIGVITGSGTNSRSSNRK